LNLYAYDEEKEFENMYAVGEAAMNIITEPKWQNPKYTLKPSGMAYTEWEEHLTVMDETARTGSGRCDRSAKETAAVRGVEKHA
jgi:hypothetical protein